MMDVRTTDAIISKVLKIPESHLNDGLSTDDVDGWDSLTHMNLIATLEEELEILFTIEQISSMGTVGEIRQAIRDNLKV